VLTQEHHRKLMSCMYNGAYNIMGCGLKLHFMVDD